MEKEKIWVAVIRGGKKRISEEGLGIRGGRHSGQEGGYKEEKTCPKKKLKRKRLEKKKATKSSTWGKGAKLNSA